VSREAWWQKETPLNMKSVNSVEELLHEMVRGARRSGTPPAFSFKLVV